MSHPSDWAIEALQPPSWNFTKKSIDLTRSKWGRRLRPCKVLGPNRTKMFHVNHFLYDCSKTGDCLLNSCLIVFSRGTRRGCHEAP